MDRLDVGQLKSREVVDPGNTYVSNYGDQLYETSLYLSVLHAVRIAQLVRGSSLKPAADNVCKEVRAMQPLDLIFWKPDVRCDTKWTLCEEYLASTLDIRLVILSLDSYGNVRARRFANRRRSPVGIVLWEYDEQYAICIDGYLSGVDDAREIIKNYCEENLLTYCCLADCFPWC